MIPNIAPLIASSVALQTAQRRRREEEERTKRRKKEAYHGHRTGRLLDGTVVRCYEEESE